MKKSTKKFAALSLCAALALAGCAGGAGQAGGAASGAPEATASAAPAAADDSYQIGIVQIVDHPSLNTIRDAFIAKIQQLDLGREVVIDQKDAQNDMSNVNSICQKFVGDKKDLIVAIATPTAQAAAAATKEIPVLFSAVSAPEESGLTGLQNVTGTSDAIPVANIFDLAATLTPEAKRVGLVYTTSEDNSAAVIKEAKAYMDENGYTYTEATITNTSELQQAASSLVGKVDAIFTPIDNTVASAMPVLAGVATMNKLPLYVGADSMVADGGLATVGIDYSLLGARTAEMAAEVLSGKSPADIPYEVLSDYSVILNQKTAKDIGVEVPEEVLAGAQIVG